MAKPNKINENIKNGYNVPGKNEDQAQSDASVDCIDCPGNGKVWILPESYQVIKHINLFTGETHFKPAGGLPFIRFPWRKHIEIIDIRNKIVNLPQKEYISKDSVTVVTDLYLQYSITDVKKFISNQLGLNEKISENTKSIVQQYFRNKDSKEIAQANISIDDIGREKFHELEQQYGIHFTQFGTTSLKLPEIDDDKRHRTEMNLRMETKKQELELLKDQIAIEKEIAQAKAEVDNTSRTEHISNILTNINKFSPDVQAQLLKQLYEIDKLASNPNANITYVSGAENFNRHK